MAKEIKAYEVDLTELRPDPNNANKGSERGQYMIDTSIADTGLHRGVAVDARNYLVAGNKTHQAAVDAGFTKAIVVETDGDTLVVTKRRDFDLLSEDPENKARRAAYFDNRSAEVSISWSPEVVFADMQAGIDLSGMFFPHEINAITQMFEEVDDPLAEWKGMPKFEQKDLTAAYSVKVNFKSLDDLKAFSLLVGQSLTEKTRSIWYPEADKIDMTSEYWDDES